MCPVEVSFDNDSEVSHDTNSEGSCEANSEVSCADFSEYDTYSNVEVELQMEKNAKMPTYGTPEAACMDIYSAEDIVILANNCAAVSTGLKMAIPPTFYLKLESRSGLALKFNVSVEGGIIDSDYRGEVKVILRNSSNKDYQVNKGDRVAQAHLEKIINFKFIKVEELEETERLGGFGSTGV